MLLSIGVCALLTSVLGDCSDGCNVPLNFYGSDDLNCKPVYASPDNCCPTQFNCSHIEARAAGKEEKCYLHGHVYNEGETTGDAPFANCGFGCTCVKKNDTGRMGFICRAQDCSDWVGAMPKPEHCHHKYEPGHCCATGIVCPPFTTTCAVDGRNYYNGQQFRAPNKDCTRCYCQEGFEEPFCKTDVCGDEEAWQYEVNNFCAPIYLSPHHCCSYYWKCPEEEDRIVPAATPSDLKCKYGEQLLNVGDKFERTTGETGKLSCECRIPPYLTCIQNPEYIYRSSDAYV